MPALCDGCTQAQREAIEHVNGPLLIVAGPVAGKTEVLVGRHAALIWFLTAEQELPGLRDALRRRRWDRLGGIWGVKVDKVAAG
ncbi:MAG TPA: UvrD-helicase domain-containing protein [Planctomycetota bacterium]|nr:UvrD-helicase domain-containing protein [Planctomycetota bacterium]